MNQILLQPTDVLFFRDGRPMSGSLAGHGAAWPLPNVISAAFHAALHRAFPEPGGDHLHRVKVDGEYSDRRTRRFGSVVTAGPFPVRKDGTWFFPRPADLLTSTVEPTLLPAISDRSASSLPKPLQHAVGSILPPAKETKAKLWLSGSAYREYLGREIAESENEMLDDENIFDTEHQIGIEIDDTTGTAGQGEVAGKFYSAQYLRLRDGWRLGTLADSQGNGHNLFTELLRTPHRIVVGGQQRVCTAEQGPAKTRIPLPIGKRDDFLESEDKFLLKWVLLTPAIWPAIETTRDRINRHPGGFLPNWINAENGAVELVDGPGLSKAKRLRREPGKRIEARLVAAIVPKPLTVTGWALGLGDEDDPGGAKSIHLAVPAGAVYYFEAESAEQVSKLADALNWHGTSVGERVVNRRSALCGEKGFGLGICSTWRYHPASGRQVTS